MNDGLDNPKPFHLRDGDSTGFADAESKVPVSWPESVESAQEELLGSLEAAGVKFPPGTWPLMLRIVSAWLEKHCDSSQVLTIHQMARLLLPQSQNPTF